MKWYAIDWFGGVKVECQECHRYKSEWTEEESRTQMAAIADNPCTTCELETKLFQANKEIKKLTASIHEWKHGKGGWFELREIIGNLWWHHPAIDSDDVRDYIRRMNRNMISKQVDVIVDGKLVGSVTSPEAEAAVRRLMSIPDKKQEK